MAKNSDHSEMPGCGKGNGKGTGVGGNPVELPEKQPHDDRSNVNNPGHSETGKSVKKPVGTGSTGPRRERDK